MNGPRFMLWRVAIIGIVGGCLTLLFKEWMLFFCTLMGMTVAAVGITWVRHTAESARHTARQQETLKFINDYNNDPAVAKGFAVIYRVADGNLSVGSAMDKVSEHRGNFLVVANKFEILAIGLDHQIYEHGMINDFFGRDIASIYRSSEQLIAYVRSQEADPKAFKEFQKLAEDIEKKRQ